MNKKSKIFLIIISAVLAVVVGVLFLRIYVFKDYVIQMEAYCDPLVDQCFTYECDVEFDEDCPEDEGERVSYFKIIERKAHDIVLCDPNDPNCNEFECKEGEYCVEVFCDEATAPDFGECSDFGEFDEPL